MSSEALTHPRLAVWLGFAGLIPFLASAGGALFLTGSNDFAITALIGYGAVILSFLGGVRWGISIAPDSRLDDESRSRELLVSIIPSVIAWSALLAPAALSILTLGISFAALLWLDRRAGRARVFPRWYTRLRLPLSIAALACLGLGLSVAYQ